MLIELICKGKGRGSPNTLRFSMSLLETVTTESVNSTYMLMYLGTVDFRNNHLTIVMYSV